MLRIAICDDDRLQLESLTQLLNAYLKERGRKSVQISAFSSPWNLLEAADSKGPFDLYLLDVVMPEMTGIELGLQLRKTDCDGLIIYLTTSPEFAVDSYLARAYHYLLKPLDQSKLFPVLDQAFAELSRTANETFLVKTRETTLRVSLDDILYAELYNRTARYHLTGGRILDSLSLRESFQTAVSPLLKNPCFVMCGASFAVNLNHVAAVQKDGAILKTGKHLPLPKQACTTLKAAWLTYWLEDKRL